MRVLDRKLIRDLGRLWAQALAIAMVMACGVATIVIAMGASRSLDETRAAFYDRYRFASVFASATRAPVHLQSRIEAIQGASRAELRIVQPVLLDISGMQEPASGLVVSIPDVEEPVVNRLYIRKGRLPRAERHDEVAIIETFAEAHGLVPGNTFDVVMNGRKRHLIITGIVLSPEFIYAIGPGDMVPDERRFGVFFMSRSAVAGIFDMVGAFNDVALSTLRDSDLRAVIETLDEILRPYGGLGAYDRSDQISNAFLDAELVQLRAMAMVIPPIFLLVSAFLVNMILSRLIALEREQVGLFKALGYSSLAIGWHYAKLVIAMSLVGVVIGSAAGFWLGRGLTRLYASFFSFPFLIFQQSVDLYAIAGGVTVAAALAGALKAIVTIVDLPPAVAMRAPPPPVYRNVLGGTLRRIPILSQLTIMALRHLVRWPVRSALTTLGTSFSVALLITALFSYDSIDFMIDTIFFRAERQDATLVFTSERNRDILVAAARLPGVLRVEPFRTANVVLRNGHLEQRVSITAIEEDSDLSRILDFDLNPFSAPVRGLVISNRVADKLELRQGDPVEVELSQKDDRVEEVAVTGLAQSYVGLAAFMRLDALNRLLRDGDRVSGVRLVIDSASLGELYRQVKQTPAIASIGLLNVSRANFRETIEKNITTMTSVYVGLAAIITFGVIYNSARIQLSERARELASLRVFGFTRAEVSSVLLTELSIMVLMAQPLGWILGYFFAWSVVKGFESDLYQIPFIVEPATFALSSLVVLIAALVSALIVRRRIDRLDLVRVLKTRE